MKYRYPGISSFETTDEDIFFGRENDRRQLTNAVTVKKSLLLYARSGMGKSSLLKAALIPELLNKGYLPYYVRLGAYQEAHSLPPTQTLLRRTVLKDNKQLPTTCLQKFITHNYSLWASFKAIQAAALTNGNLQQPIVLIIDQFEELFSYPTKQITEFKQQLAELLYTAIPQNYLDALEDSDFLMTSPLTSTETDALYTPLQVKVVFSIRSDQMSLLNELTDYLPTILKEFYELKPLTEQQALEAIIAPAQEKGEFHTPTFVYQEDAKKKILKALSSQKQKGIDTAQLQIVLQYIEKDIVEAKQDYDLTAEDLGDLNKVYENYYYNSLAKLPNVTEKEKARRLIEDRLIVEGRRISYDEQLCLQQVNTTTLTTLVETRLLRREPNSTDGFSYELSHDTLVKPVLDAKKLYDEEQEKLRQAEELRISKIEKAKREKQFRNLSIAFVIAILAVIGAVYFGFDAQNNLKSFKIEEQKRKEDNINKLLTEASNFEKLGQTDIAILRLKIALSIDSNNPKIINELKRIPIQALPSVGKEKYAIFSLLMDRAKQHYEGTPARYQEAINAYMAAMLDCPEKAEEAQNKISQVFQEIETIRIKEIQSTKIAKDAKIQAMEIALANEKTEKELTAAMDALNTVFYITGSKKVLEKKGLIDTRGLFKKIDGLVNNLSLDVFIKGDKRYLKEINAGQAKKKNIVLLPKRSGFELIEENYEVIIKITDAEEFWKTKYVAIIID